MTSRTKIEEVEIDDSGILFANYSDWRMDDNNNVVYGEKLGEKYLPFNDNVLTRNGFKYYKMEYFFKEKKKIGDFDSL